MASLDDFQTTGRASLADFTVEGPMLPVGNDASLRNLAAFTSALSQNPQSVEATYLNISSRLRGERGNEVAQQLVESSRNEVRKKSQGALVSVMTDPSLSDEEKEAASTAYFDERSSLYDIQNIASAEALAADSDPDETVEAETARVNFGETLQEANAFRRDKQKLLSAEMAKGEQGVMSNIADFLEIMIPFSEGSVSGRTVSGMRGGDPAAIAQGLAWTGGSKAEIRDAMKGLPIEKRRQVMRSIVDAANESSTIILSGDNEFARMEMIRIALEESAYGAGEEWLDNSIAVLDMLGLFGAATRGIRAGARSLRGGRAARGIETPSPSVEQQVRDRPYVETATDEELRAAEDAAESSAVDSALRTQEDASEARVGARQAAVEADPVRRGEDAATARAESRAAVRGEGREALSEMEAGAERRADARRTGGAAARMTDEELRISEDAAEAVQTNLVSKARLEAARAPVQPSSYSQVLRNTNPAKARAANRAVTDDESGQVASAMYGSSRADALAHDHMPEVKQLGGEVKSKVTHPDVVKTGPAKIPKDIKDVVDSSGALHFTEAQKVSVAARVVHDFNNAVGLTARTEMTVPLGRDIGGQFQVGVTYGPRDGGWTDPAAGVAKVKNSMRNYGVEDSDIVLMGRQGDEYAPTSLDNPVGTDFLVQVKYNHDISAAEVDEIAGWDAIDMVKNWHDRVPHKFGGVTGTVTRSLFDPASIFKQDILGGATTSVLRAATLEKRLGDLTRRFSNKFNKLNKDQQQIFDQEIRRANLEGWNMPTATLRADGWSDTAIKALENWRDTWDAIYWLRNKALAKDLDNNGYKTFVDPANNTRLFVKERKRRGVGDSARVYDPIDGELKTLTPEKLDKLYEEGGSVGVLRSKFVHNGEETVEQVLVRNTPESFARKVREDDQVLTYREGYYTVYYDSPRFVDEIVTDRHGKELMRKAVSTSRDIGTAQRTADSLNGSAPPNTRYVARDAQERTSYTSDDLWNVTESGGGISQRVRGERLEDANSAVTDEMSNHVMGPADSLVRAIRSVSPKVAMGDFFDAMETRGINQFGHMFPKDKYGRPVFPQDSGPRSIQADLAYGAEARDARTFVEYVNSLRRPYYNSIDDGVKNLFRAFAEATGEQGFSRVERAADALAEGAQPTRLGKGVAFTLYIALNAPRALLVQSFQAVQLLSLNPSYVMGRLRGDMTAMTARHLGGRTKDFANWAEASNKQYLDDMYEALSLSGTTAVIDKSNLVRGTMQEISDATSMGGRRSAWGQVTGRASQAVTISRKAGFDAGESFNKVSSWITHYNMKKKEVGDRKLTRSEIDKVTADSENWTYNMNRAGEFPWNENALGLVMQYLQVPYKAFLTMTTNRSISGAQKARLAAFNATFFGAVPGSFLYMALGDHLPTDQEGWNSEARDAFVQGLGAYMFNKSVGGLYEFFSDEGQWADMDFSSLRAIDGKGLFEYATSLMTTNVGEIAANTPAGSLVLGYNPRISNAIKSVAELFHFREPADGSRVGVAETLQEVSSVASGFSNAFKAIQIGEYEKVFNSEGGVTADHAPTPVAIARLFGINTMEESQKWYMDTELYEQSSSFKEDAKERYRLISKGLWKEGMSMAEEERARETINRINLVFKDSDEAKAIALQELRKDIQAGDDVMIVRVMNLMAISKDSLVGEINAMPIDPQRKEQLFRMLDGIEAQRNQE